MLEVRCTDKSGGTIGLKWFHSPAGMEKRFIPGQSLRATGALKSYMGRTEIVHPEISFKSNSLPGMEDQQDYNTGRIVPVYTEIEGIPTRTLRKILWDAVENYAHLLVEDLPEVFLKERNLPKLTQSIRAIHFPAEQDESAVQTLAQFRTPPQLRLIYEEFFKFEFLVLRKRLNAQREYAVTLAASHLAEVEKAETALPFRLTQGQSKALEEILDDLKQGFPMNRLVQGDVGSGKTAVALLSAMGMIAAGHQVVLMAPTEILAEQHSHSAQTLFKNLLPWDLLTGKSTSADRKRILKRLSQGEPFLLIGTHALLEDPVVFKKLSLLIIDEQHRFGVEQRRTLRLKGVREENGKALQPHTLVLTATPIPRTLALTAYGDLAVSTIRELPPGRRPVKTFKVNDHSRARAMERVREEIRAGRQAYFIFPLVNQSEAEGFTELKAATKEAERLATEVFPEFKVALLHGQMGNDEKQETMARFKTGESQILVSTTVVEVGVDVPNATVMAIEHAERFGLSQLHQLRGRVGRGQHDSICFLFTHGYGSETTQARLEVLEQTQDGFEIAEADLEIRGPGEFLGTRQSGALPFRLAHLIRDKDLLLSARDDAMKLLSSDPDLTQEGHQRLKNYYIREGSLQFDRLKTS